MKKTLILLLFIAIIIACNSSEDSKNKNSTVEETIANPEATKGLALVANSDCFTCHKVSEPLTGPAYLLVAEKYPDNEESINYLSDKIQKGGSGVWGTIPMLPHPDINNDDAKLMAKYILSLK